MGKAKKRTGAPCYQHDSYDPNCSDCYHDDEIAPRREQPQGEATCPTCGAWRDKERVISPVGGFVPCADPWHGKFPIPAQTDGGEKPLGRPNGASFPRGYEPDDCPCGSKVVNGTCDNSKCPEPSSPPATVGTAREFYDTYCESPFDYADIGGCFHKIMEFCYKFAEAYADQRVCHEREAREHAEGALREIATKAHDGAISISPEARHFAALRDIANAALKEHNDGSTSGIR